MTYTLSIEDIDYEIAAIEYVMLTMMRRYKQLEDEREVVMKDLHEANVRGEVKRRSGGCLCSYSKEGFEINPKCPQHGK